MDFGVAAPHQNYDVTSRASNDAGFFKNFNTHVFSPKCTILLSYSKIETGRFFLVHHNVNELEQKLSQRTLRPVLVPSSKLMCWQTRSIPLLLNHVKLLALCKSRFVRKITFGGILSLQAFGKRLADLGKKPLKQNKEKIGRLKSSPYLISKKLSEKQSAIHGIAL